RGEDQFSRSLCSPAAADVKKQPDSGKRALREKTRSLFSKIKNAPERERKNDDLIFLYYVYMTS
ncbi:hypothetical protein, partial [Enterobacter roggenkampii]|uniref:hypothetical protein n=1 Tax=Enterobacter roggenkampii TaxID=1812935 RepID=UPI00197AFF29